MRPRSRPRNRWSNYISDLAWSCLGVEQAELVSRNFRTSQQKFQNESAEISEIAVDREIFRVLGLLGLRRILPLWEKCFYSFTKPLLLKYVVHIVHSWYNLVQCYS